MTFLCGMCRKEKASIDFYLKHKDREATKRSDWCGWCIECMKQYKKDWYAANSARVNREHKRQRFANHEQSLKLEAARRLAKSKDPSAVLRRRTVADLDGQTRYLHDRTRLWERSARLRGLEWSLTRSDVESMLEGQAGLCYYTGLKMVLAPNAPETVSLDRVDSSKGYTRSNVVLCCSRVNLMKLDMTVLEFREVVRLLHTNDRW